LRFGAPFPSQPFRDPCTVDVALKPMDLANPLEWNQKYASCQELIAVAEPNSTDARAT
jgi:hypothetical protein